MSSTYHSFGSYTWSARWVLPGKFNVRFLQKVTLKSFGGSTVIPLSLTPGSCSTYDTQLETFQEFYLEFLH